MKPTPWSCHGTHPVTPSTTICRFPPQSAAICGNLSAICLQYPQCPRPLPSPRNSTNFHRKDNSTPPPESVCAQYHACPVPIPYLLYSCSLNNQVNNINSSPLFPTFFPYIMSWLYYIVYIYSLIISTSLYIIVTCTHSVTLSKE